MASPLTVLGHPRTATERRRKWTFARIEVTGPRRPHIRYPMTPGRWLFTGKLCSGTPPARLLGPHVHLHAGCPSGGPLPQRAGFLQHAERTPRRHTADRARALGLAENQHAGLIFVRSLTVARNAPASAHERNLAVDGGMVWPRSVNSGCGSADGGAGGSVIPSRFPAQGAHTCLYSAGDQL